MSSEQLKLGDKVQYTAILNRKDVDLTPGASSSDWGRCWVPQPLTTPGSGIIVGIRTLADGKVNYGYNADSVTNFVQEKTYQAYRVASEMRRKPFFVLPDDVTLVEEDETEIEALRKDVEALKERLDQESPGVSDIDAILLEVLQENFGEALACTRDWSAWNHGSMSSEDFQSAFEEDGAAQDAIQSIKNIVDDVVRQAIQKEREGLLVSISEMPPAKGFTYNIGDTLEVGVRLKVLLGDDWQVLLDKIKAQALI